MTPPAPLELLYEGKAKQVFATDDPHLVIVRYKDDATAFNAEKRGTVVGKGEVNNAVTALLYRELEAFGVPTHFRDLLGPREQLVAHVRIVPVEVIVRNRTAGTFAKRYGVEEGLPLDPKVIEFCLKSDALGDPPMNAATAVALGHATEEELEELFDLAATVNDYLTARFAVAGLDLIDFKLEFGVDRDGRIVLADEISPDTCRLWDHETAEKLDKDRFRRDLGRVEEAYQEVRRRLEATVGVPLEFPEDDHEHHDHEHHHDHDEEDADA
ncbi:MAG: phosphoribosylaminoimidazolesuccinocarboxamide synthase [Trueperaceae bacterium]|nr:phosphoribosylaminoimidazolesuccinocarboxamide synthase [Trueperaceae bacterium]